jgi:hypothetical protein
MYSPFDAHPGISSGTIDTAYVFQQQDSHQMLACFLSRRDPIMYREI